MAALKDNSLNETALFVDIITRMEHSQYKTTLFVDIITRIEHSQYKNVMSSDQLKDDDRKPFRPTDDSISYII